MYQGISKTNSSLQVTDSFLFSYNSVSKYIIVDLFGGINQMGPLNLNKKKLYNKLYFGNFCNLVIKIM